MRIKLTDEEVRKLELLFEQVLTNHKFLEQQHPDWRVAWAALRKKIATAKQYSRASRKDHKVGFPQAANQGISEQYKNARRRAEEEEVPT